LPSIETAIAPPVSARVSTAASACSGRRTVREPTTGSYCSKAQRFEARFGEPSSASAIALASLDPPSSPAARPTASPSEARLP
jgi:hypothetical protein